MTAPGRNDPCPCGSGRKYKHCCLNAPQNTPDPVELAGRRLARAYEGYPARLLAFARKVYGPDVLQNAAIDFGLQDGFDPDDVDMPLFMPWFMHHWCPEASEGDCPPEFDAMPPAHVYFDRHRSREQPLLEVYAWECMRAPYAFHEVCRVEPGRGMVLREYFSGQESFVHERTASATLQPGQCIFALCVPVAEGSRIEAIGAYATEVGPPAGLSALRTEARQEGPADPEEQLWEYAAELRDIYLQHADFVTGRVQPSIVTRGGDPLEQRELHYAISSAHTVFQGLRDLDALDGGREALAQAEFTPGGRVSRARLAWLREPDHDREEDGYLQVAEFEIKPREMTVHVLSRRRVDAVKALLAERLGNKATLRAEVLVSTRGGDAPMPHSPSPATAPPPEIQEAIEARLRQHYADWVDHPLPALDGKTPREAVKTDSGRVAVDRLLRMMERPAPDGTFSAPRDVFEDIRRRLGL